MKKRSFMFIVMALVMAFGMAAFATGCGSSGVKKVKTIAVVAKGESHAFWQSVKKGAEAAGKATGYEITFTGPPSESAQDLPKQIEQVTAALSANPSAMVLATIGEGFVDLLSQAYEKHIPVVQFDSGIWPNDIKALNEKFMNPVVASVATSNTAAAAVAAEKFFEKIKGDIAAATTSDQYVIGIIQHDETQTGIDRAKGFEDRIKELIQEEPTTAGKAKIVKQVKPGDANNAYQDAMQYLKENNKRLDSVFMSNEGVVKQVFDLVNQAKSVYKDIKFYGFDAGTKQIDWIKRTEGKVVADCPVLLGSVAQDSYSIGFEAVKAAADYLIYQEVGIKGSDWDSTNVDDMIERGLVYEG